MRAAIKYISLIVLLIFISINIYLYYYQRQRITTTCIDSLTFNRFIKAYQLIKTHALYPIDDSALINDAIQGMLTSVDPHSSYLTEPQSFNATQLATSKFVGIGVEISPNIHGLKILTTLPESPAKKIGLKPNDEIIAINAQLIANMPYREAIQKLHGPIGSEVTLTLVRPTTTHPFSVRVIRTAINTQPVNYYLATPKIGVLQIHRFEKNTAQNVHQNFMQLQKASHFSLQGLIIDLRNNPGGLLTASAQVSDLFLDGGTLKNRWIVYCKNNIGKIIFSAKADAIDITHDIPIIVLVNKNTASSAEIMAAALQQHHRAFILGTPTKGKGSVQSIIPLDNQEAIKLTTALYYTPNGKTIDGKGVIPNKIVQQNPNEDTQLNAAILQLTHQKYL